MWTFSVFTQIKWENKKIYKVFKEIFYKTKAKLKELELNKQELVTETNLYNPGKVHLKPTQNTKI